MKSSNIRSFIIIGLSVLTVVYQFRNKLLPGPTATPASQSQPSGQTEAAAPAAISIPVPLSPTIERQVIPPTGWGRNPFLTPEEVETLKIKPEEPIIIANESIPTPKPAEPGGMPAYSLTAIFSGREGKWALVNSRMVQTGDRLGIETIEEIKDDAVLLQFEGRTRELRLKRLDEIPPPPAKGAVQQGEVKK